MDYIFYLLVFIGIGLNFTLLCGLIGSGITASIIDLFDKKFKQRRLADSLFKAVRRGNKNFNCVAIITDDYEILVARKIKDSTND